MSDEMARALGAESPMTVTIAGKACAVRPLGIKELEVVQRDCLERFKDRYLETWSKGLRYLPADKGVSLMAEKIDEAAHWDIDSLPHKFAYDARRVKLTDALKARLTEAFGAQSEIKEDRWQSLTAAALDQGLLTEEECVTLSGSKPFKAKIAYVNWWITGCYDGMISLTWVCFRHNGVTREQIEEELSGKMSLLTEVTREIEKLSTPKLGNG